MAMGIRRTGFCLLLGCCLLLFPALPVRAMSDGMVAWHGRQLLAGDDAEVARAAAALVARGKRDVVPTLILALRYGRQDEVYQDALRRLTGHDAGRWFDWMLWQETHPEPPPHPSYLDAKLSVLLRIDPNFMRFLTPSLMRPERMKIRLEEITWGGVRVDGIPTLDHPDFLAAAEADYLAEDDLVFGVSINGDHRAYPLRIMGWHEMFNDTVGGVDLALAYCTLCGAGILFESRLPDRPEPFMFGSSGLLYRSNKLMFDRQTDSLWNQFTGRPVSGALVDSGIELKIRPVVVSDWATWRRDHPDTKVLSLETGHRRDYGSGAVYRDYFASPELMFPARVDQRRLAQKDRVFGIRTVGAAKAWPLATFRGGRVINDQIGDLPLVLIGDADRRTVRAYRRGNGRFRTGDAPNTLSGPGGTWTVGEENLLGPAGEKLARMPGHIAYWFAWNNYLGPASELAGER